MPYYGYKRKYMRVKPDNDLFADMTIVSVGGRKVRLGSARVLVENISPGGLRFITALNFPVNPLVLFGFDINACGQVIHLSGIITNKTILDSAAYAYGVNFTNVDGIKRSCLIKLFNNMIVRTRNCVVILRLNQR